MNEELINRPVYLNNLIKFLETPEIKVLIGVRRCGKSSLLQLLAEHLRGDNVPKTNVIHIKLDSFDLPLELNAQWLSSKIAKRLERLNPDKEAFVLLDEVQEVEGWERVVRKLHTRPHTRIFITGSNSKVLSGDLATFLAGRFLEFPVYPLNFEEYQFFAKERGWKTENPVDLLSDFMTYGGMPGLFYHKQGDVEAYDAVLSSIFDTVVLKDVIARHSITDTALLNRLIKYVFSTSGNLLSIKKIVDMLNSSGRHSSQETVDNYIKALTSSKMLQECQQNGTSGREILRPKNKFYVVDNGLRNLTIGFSRTKDLGFQFEGLIHNELRTRGWQTQAIKTKEGLEVDFLATRKCEKIYVQASLSVLDEATFVREVKSLEAINDSFDKFIVVMDNMRVGVTDRGIKIVNIIDFLKMI